MAVIKGPSGLVKNRDIRVLRVFREYLLRNNMVRGAARWDDVEKYLSEINHALPRFYPDMLERDRFITELLSKCRSHCVSKSDVGWLDSDDKACTWFWLTKLVFGGVEGSYGSERGSNKSNGGVMAGSFNFAKFKSGGKGGDWRLHGYNELGFNVVPVPSSHEDRMSLIIEYLDRVTCETTLRDQIIVYSKSQWSMIFNSNDFLKWVERRDEEQCEWVWSCLRKEVVPHLYSTGLRSVGELLPMSPSEMYLFSYAVFHFWGESAAGKELLVRKMKNAWGQKKFRRKKASKRSINTYIDVGVGEMLDELVFHYDLTIHRTIEILIKKEHARLKDKGR